MTGHLRTKPAERTRDVGTVLTNFDHGIDDELARELVAPDAYGTYAAWDFYGQAVWCEDEQFHVEIWCYHQHVDTISAGSLEALMAEASEAWGYE